MGLRDGSLGAYMDSRYTISRDDSLKSSRLIYYHLQEANSRIKNLYEYISIWPQKL